MTLTREQALASDTPRLGVFFRLGLTPPLRIWLGIGDCDAGIDAADGAGATYTGIGEMLDVPTFTQLVNGAAERVEFHLSGVTERMLQLASTDANDVKGAALLVGVGVFDGSWQLIAAPTWLRRFTVDYLSIRYENARDGANHTISLSARSFLTGRRRPGLSYFTDHDQQELSSGDLFCERSVLYSNATSKTWPRF